MAIQETGTAGSRYGYNGKPQDSRLGGVGREGSYDYGFRAYDASLARFFAVDPLREKYPELTPYQFASNRPIDGVDEDGKEWSSCKDENGRSFITLKVRIAPSLEKITSWQIEMFKAQAEEEFSKRFSGEGVDANLVFTDDAQIILFFREKVVSQDGAKAGGSSIPASAKNGDGKPYGTQQNMLKVRTMLYGKARSIASMVRSFLHEAGHSSGLPHIWEPESPSDASQSNKSIPPESLKMNLMNSAENPAEDMKYFEGLDVTPGQRDLQKKTIESQQPPSGK